MRIMIFAPQTNAPHRSPPHKEQQLGLFSDSDKLSSRFAQAFSSPEKQENSADHETAALLKRFSANPVQKARVDSTVLKKSKRDSMSSLGSTR